MGSCPRSRIGRGRSGRHGCCRAGGNPDWRPRSPWAQRLRALDQFHAVAVRVAQAQGVGHRGVSNIELTGRSFRRALKAVGGGGLCSSRCGAQQVALDFSHRVDRAVRLAGLYAVLAAVASFLVTPLLALSYFATESGDEELEVGSVSAWAEPARDLAGGLLTFASADSVDGPGHRPPARLVQTAPDSVAPCPQRSALAGRERRTGAQQPRPRAALRRLGRDRLAALALRARCVYRERSMSSTR